MGAGQLQAFLTVAQELHFRAGRRTAPHRPSAPPPDDKTTCGRTWDSPAGPQSPFRADTSTGQALNAPVTELLVPLRGAEVAVRSPTTTRGLVRNASPAFLLTN